jgi:metallo-beta-lactamase family protein
VEHERTPGKPNPFHCHNLHQVHDHRASKQLNTLDGPAIIIAGSGMLTGGRILHHLKAYGRDRGSTIVLIGYQADGTRGRALIEGAQKIKIHGGHVAIRCHIEHIESLSAHGDQNDMMQWLKGFRRPPVKTFLVHSEPGPAQALAARIHEELQWTVEIPRYLQRITLA